MKRMLILLLAAMMLMTGLTALAQAKEIGESAFDPTSAFTTREVNVLIAPQEGAQTAFLLASGAVVSWLTTVGDWAYVNAYGDSGYVPADALTTDRIFQFDSHPTQSVDWPYAGELRVSPDGTVRIAISMAEEYTDGALFGGAELFCFEVVDEFTGELICTAEPDLNCDPVIYSGEGVYTQGTALLVIPVLRHGGYSVEIQW